MKIISAGWRMAYISEGGGKGCIFCARRRSHRDRENFIVRRGKHAFVMMNRYPYTTGHLMVAPYRHVGSLAGLTQDEACEMMRLTAVCETLLRKAMNPNGFNVGINMGRCAGAGYPGHIHIHVVPRWDGDTNFMPVVSETKVLPETLSDTYGRLMRVKVGENDVGPRGGKARGGSPSKSRAGKRVK
jgi:ATP adenylyltransferase